MEAASQTFGEKTIARIETIRSARDHLPSVKAKTAAAEPNHRKAILQRLADVTGKPDILRFGTDSEIAQFWTAYHDVLGHVPAEVLSRACTAFLSLAPEKPGQKWLPDPGTLLSLCRQDEAWRDNLRLRKGLERLATAQPERPVSHIGTDAQEAELKRRMEALKTRWHTQDREKAQAESTSGQSALDWYRNPRPWHRQPMKMAAE